MDQFKVWIHSSNPDVLVITETWLRKGALNTTKSVPPKMYLLVLTIQLSNISLLTVAGCYHPPSAPARSLSALSSLLATYTKSEFVLLGDLNWDMLKPPDQVLKQWDSLNLSQIITNPTR